MAKKPEKGDWTVTMRCVVTKVVDLQGCTEEEARRDPWAYVVGDEREVDQIDWDVQKVERND